jgi:hypothetical protein
VQDKGLAHLLGLAQLKELRCAQCRLTKLSLASLTKLESLDVSLTPFNDEGMKGLAGLQQLRRLHLRDTLVTDAGLQSLSGLTNLEELDLSGAKISDAGIAHLRKLTALRKLNLLGATISDESAATLAGMTQLRELILYRSRLTNAGLAKLGTLKELTSFDLRYSRVTGTGVEAFRAAVPNCKVNFVDARMARSKTAKFDRPTATNAEAIAQWITALGGKAEFAGANLRAISLAATSIGDAQLAHLVTLTELEALDLEATEIGDLGLQSLKALTSLQTLNLSNTTVSDAGLAHLAALSQLRALQLGGTLVRGSGLAQLKRLPLLTKLDLIGALIGNEGVRQLAESTSLERLHLSSTDVTNDGLQYLSKLPRLQILDLDSIEVREETAARLQAIAAQLKLSLDEYLSRVADLLAPGARGDLGTSEVCNQCTTMDASRCKRRRRGRSAKADSTCGQAASSQHCTSVIKGATSSRTSCPKLWLDVRLRLHFRPDRLAQLIAQSLNLVQLALNAGEEVGLGFDAFGDQEIRGLQARFENPGGHQCVKRVGFFFAESQQDCRVFDIDGAFDGFVDGFGRFGHKLADDVDDFFNRGRFVAAGRGWIGH